MNWRRAISIAFFVLPGAVPLATADTAAPEQAVRSEADAPARPAEDPVAARQSMDAFTSIEDAQPGLPGRFELRMDAGWEKYSSHFTPFVLEPELKYTGKGNHFLENTKITLTMPFELGEGEEEGNGDILLGWQQRWVAEHAGTPTLGTLLELRLPTGNDSSGVDVKLTGILDKDVGKGTAYLSAYVKGAGGSEDELNHFQWGAQAGYKWPVSDKVTVMGNLVHESAEDKGAGSQNLLQIAGEYHANSGLIVGPGVWIGLDNHEDTPDVAVGVRLTYPF